MRRRDAYFYFMRDNPAKEREIVPEHVDYRKRLNLDDYIGGGFADRSGGLIIFSAENLEAAENIVAADPFSTNNLYERVWLKEWNVG